MITKSIPGKVANSKLSIPVTKVIKTPRPLLQPEDNYGMPAMTTAAKSLLKSNHCRVNDIGMISTRKLMLEYGKCCLFNKITCLGGFINEFFKPGWQFPTGKNNTNRCYDAGLLIVKRQGNSG